MKEGQTAMSMLIEAIPRHEKKLEKIMRRPKGRRPLNVGPRIRKEKLNSDGSRMKREGKRGGKRGRGGKGRGMKGEEDASNDSNIRSPPKATHTIEELHIH